MAIEQYGYIKRYTGKAAVDLSAKQFRFVKLAVVADSLGIDVTSIAATTDVPFGVSQDTPTAGDLGGIVTLGGSKAIVGAGGITVGDWLGIDNTGAVITLAYPTGALAGLSYPTLFVVGQALQTCAAGAVAFIDVDIKGRLA